MTVPMKRLVPPFVLFAALVALPLLAAAATPFHYRLTREIPIAGDDGWDYLSFDGSSGRLFVAHGTRVQVIDTGTLLPAGEIADTLGVHGVALANDLGRGYVSCGRSGTIVVFDVRSLARLQEIPATGEGPDAILYDPFTRRVFSFNGRGRNATAIDAVKNEVVGTVPLDAKPEFAVSDGTGKIYVNLEDTGSIAVIDARTLAVEHVWPVATCEEPTGLAIDRAHHRLFTGCRNRKLAIVDATSGRLVATLPIGAGVDATAFDPGAGLAFASAGDGTLTVVREETPERFLVAQTVTTKPGARTMALDEHTHRLYLVSAGLGPRPTGSPEQPQPHPPILPGSFVLLVVER
jgi:DNA-binding beta-propeller fold protein YncE